VSFTTGENSGKEHKQVQKAEKTKSAQHPAQNKAKENNKKKADKISGESNKKGAAKKKNNSKKKSSAKKKASSKKNHSTKKKKGSAAKKKSSSGKKKSLAAKKKGKAKKGSSNVKQTSGCLASNCLDLAVSYIGLLRTRVTNYQKQIYRINRNLASSSAKGVKQNSFSTTLNQLITAGQGNISDLVCGASRNNSGKVDFFKRPFSW
jgi:hypothetical protein